MQAERNQVLGERYTENDCATGFLFNNMSLEAKSQPRSFLERFLVRRCGVITLRAVYGLQDGLQGLVLYQLSRPEIKTG